MRIQDLVLGRVELARLQARERQRHARPHRFLKGPVPWPWLARAAALPGRALAVSVVLWHYAGMARTRTVALNLSRLPLAIERSTASRGLSALERVGLVRVQRLPGHKLLVTILPVA